MFPTTTEEERRRQAEILSPALAPSAGATAPAGFYESQSPDAQALMPAMAPDSDFKPLAVSPERPALPAAPSASAMAGNGLSGAGDALMRQSNALIAMQPRAPMRTGVSPGTPLPTGPAPLARGSLRRPSGRPMMMSDRTVKVGISTGNAAVEAVLDRLSSNLGA